MASEQNVIQIDDLLGRMDKLPPGSFNAAGGVHNVQERADTFLKGTPLAGAVGGAIHAVSGGQYQPRSAEDAAAVEDFRLSAQRYLNKQATEGLGMNQTDQEIRRKSAELGQLLNDPNKLMFNDDATMRRALLIGKEIEQKLMAQRARVLSANAAPGTEGARAGQAHSGTAGYAPPPWEDVVEAPERTPAPPVQGPDDSADGTGSPEAYNPAEVFAPEQTPDMAVPQLQMGAALENAGAPTSLEQRVHPGPPPKAPVPTTAVQAARPVLAKMGKGKAKAGGAKLSGPAQQLLAAFTSNDGKFDADGFVESAHRSGMSDADIHAALKSRGL
jgi:hypothetical protein